MQALKHGEVTGRQRVRNTKHTKIRYAEAYSQWLSLCVRPRF